MRACARMYARAYDCGQIVIRTQDQDHDRNTAGTRTTGKERNTRPPEKPVYICLIADNEKKYKKVKKNLEIRKSRRIFVAVIKNQTT